MKNRWLIVILWSYICVSCSPSVSTVSLVYNSTFMKDTIIDLERVEMYPAQLNPRCMLLNNDRILIRTSTMADKIYSVYSYPKMEHLTYFGNQSEYIVPLEQSNDDFYLVRSDSLFFYKWVEGDSLMRSSASYFYDVMGQRMLGVAKLQDNLYAYSNNYFDRGVDEYFVVNLSQKQKTPKGTYPDSHVDFNTLSDFKSAYAHSILAKPDGSRLLVFYLRTRRCRIYAQDGILLHDILLNYEPCQTMVDTDMKKRFLHIRDAYVTDNAIYLLCPDAKDGNSSFSLLVGNWNGEFKCRYHLKQHISYFFVDESLNRFCGINSNDPCYFYLFNLDND